MERKHCSFVSFIIKSSHFLFCKQNHNKSQYSIVLMLDIDVKCRYIIIIYKTGKQDTISPVNLAAHNAVGLAKESKSIRECLLCPHLEKSMVCYVCICC